MDQRAPPRPKSTTIHVTMHAGRMGMTRQVITIVVIASSNLRTILTHTWVITQKQVLVRRTNNFQSGPDGVGRYNYTVK